VFDLYFYFLFLFFIFKILGLNFYFLFLRNKNIKNVFLEGNVFLDLFKIKFIIIVFLFFSK